MKTPALVLLAGLLAAASTVGAQAVSSGEAARVLMSGLDRLHLDAIATVDPEAPGTFVAALKISASQLLVVQARHPSVDGILQRLAAHQYREVYLDLQGTPTPKGTFVVQDAGANGILGALPGSGDVDVLYEDVGRQTIFNGDPIGQQLTAAEYEEKLASADSRYARLLTLLTSALPEIKE